MPYRQPPPFPVPSPPPSASPTTQFHPSPHHGAPPPSRLLTPVAGVLAGFSFLLCLVVFFRKLWRKRTVPADAKPPYRYSYSVLRHATSSFSAANRLGQGGFGSVYRGTLKSGKEIAVKVMDSGSLQGEREFQNELFFAGRIDSNYIVPVIGFSSDRRRQRMILVYELMSNGNLQDALLDRKCSELMDWKKRFEIAMDVAKGIEYLHSLDPPAIHGDIKPSNILLDRCFSAKIGDFGLAKSKSEDQVVVVVVDDAIKMNGREEAKKKELVSCGGGAVDDNASVVEDTESVATGFEEMSVNVEQSPESFAVDAVASSPGSETFDRVSVESVGGKRKKNMVGKDGWPRQDNGAMEVGSVKDYVREWMGMELRKESPNDHWIGASSSGANLDKLEKKKEKSWKKEKRRPAREWWKEEFCEELARKKKKKMKRQKGRDKDFGGENWWPTDEDMYVDRKKKSKRSSRGGSKGSVDWWLDGLSGELWRARRNSHDSASGEIPKSGGISSTPSMRGTMCYVAPEYGGGGDVSEKCDVYSFGVLLLVVIAGRRPLQVTASPMAEFQRANLISWARNLARAGKLINLVDQSIQSLDREQALLCIMVALICLQKSPARRPSMREVVGMLSGDSEPPKLPFEFSPSPPSRFPFKSQKKVR